MKALSLWQPWASLVVWGLKRVETRGWDTAFRGPLLIHAAKRWDGPIGRLCQATYFAEALGRMGATLPDRYAERPPGLPFGALIGVATITRCYHTGLVRHHGAHEGPPLADGDDLVIGRKETAFGDYGPGRSAWLLADVARFREPVPYTGRQSLFEVPDFTLPADMIPEPTSVRTGRSPVFADYFGPEADR